MPDVTRCKRCKRPTPASRRRYTSSEPGSPRIGGSNATTDCDSAGSGAADERTRRLRARRQGGGGHAGGGGFHGGGTSMGFHGGHGGMAAVGVRIGHRSEERRVGRDWSSDCALPI